MAKRSAVSSILDFLVVVRMHIGLLPHVHTQRRRHGQVLVGPHHRAVRSGDLERQAGADHRDRRDDGVAPTWSPSMRARGLLAAGAGGVSYGAGSVSQVTAPSSTPSPTPKFVTAADMMVKTPQRPAVPRPWRWPTEPEWVAHDVMRSIVSWTALITNTDPAKTQIEVHRRIRQRLACLKYPSSALPEPSYYSSRDGHIHGM